MKYRRTPQFLEDLASLPNDVKAKIPRAFDIFKDNPHHPSLQTKKIQGAKTRNGKDIWEGRLDLNHRFTFHYDGDTIWFRRIGKHDIIERDRE